MRSFALLLAVLTGCDFFFDHGHDDCKAVPQAGVDLAPANQLRNPQTGLCEAIGNPPSCDSQCGPCPETDFALPNWGSCFSNCEGLDEGKCQSTDGCLAAYTDFPTADQAPQYRGCFATAPSGPIHAGVCRGLDAQSCTEHDNCTIHYGDFLNGRPAEFLTCLDEVVVTPAACTTLATESACLQRADCEPVYKGDDCTCTPSTCDCNVLTYQQCHAK